MPTERKIHIPTLVAGAIISLFIFSVFNSFRYIFLEDSIAIHTMNERIGLLLIWLFISSLCLFTYFNLVVHFPHDTINIIFSCLTIAAFSALILYSSKGYQFFYLTIPVGIAFITIKIVQLYYYAKKSVLAEPALNYLKAILISNIVFFLISAITCFYLENNNVILWLKDMVKVDGLVDTISLIEASNEISSINNYDSIIQGLKESNQMIELNAYRLALSFAIALAALFIYILVRILRVVLLRLVKNDNVGYFKTGPISEMIKEHYEQPQQQTGDTLSVNFKEFILLTRSWHSIAGGLVAGFVYYKLSYALFESMTCAIMVYCTTAFGFVLNNIIDRFKDSMTGVKKVNLVQSIGKLNGSKVIAFCLFLFSILCSTILLKQTFFINLIVLVILSNYSYVNNRYGILANMLTCLCVYLIFWLYPAEDEMRGLVAFLSSFAFLYMLARELVLDDFDKSDDLKVGKTSASILFGSKNVLTFSQILLILNAFIFSGIIYFANFNVAFYLPVILGSLLNLYGITNYRKMRTEGSFNFFYRISSVGYLTILVAISFIS